MRKYFKEKKEDPSKGTIEIFGERYILVRAASMSVDFFETIKNSYKDQGEEEAEKNRNFFKQIVIRKEPFYGLENVNLHKDGHLVVLERNGIPVFDQKGELKGYRGIDRDISERKMMEEELKKHREHLEREVEDRPGS